MLKLKVFVVHHATDFLTFNALEIHQHAAVVFHIAEQEHTAVGYT